MIMACDTQDLVLLHNVIQHTGSLENTAQYAISHAYIEWPQIIIKLVLMLLCITYLLVCVCESTSWGMELIILKAGEGTQLSLKSFF